MADSALEHPIEALRRHLVEYGPSGPRVADCLRESWEHLEGSDETSMAARKVWRLESPEWNPPVLSFTMERHGGTVLGSTRAELQRWHINLDTRTATAVPAGYRQLRPASPRLDMKPIALELAAAVVEGRDSPNLEWSSDRSSVRILTSRVLGAGAKQTLEGRRSRLNDVLIPALAAAGWKAGAQAGRYVRA